MSTGTITHTIHDCHPPSHVNYVSSIPSGEHSMIVDWRCPGCQQRWRIIIRHHGSEATTFGRNRRKRKVRK